MFKNDIALMQSFIDKRSRIFKALLMILTLCRNYKKHIRLLMAMIYAYAFCLAMRSAVVTCIDCYANGDSGIMVYVMTCISVGALTLIKPSIFA